MSKRSYSCESLSSVCFLCLQTIFRNPNTTKAYAIPGPDRLNVPAIEVRTTHDSIVTVDMEVPSCHVAVQRWQANTPDGRGMPFLFQHGRSNLGASGGALMRMFSRPVEDEESRFPKAVALPPAGVKLGSIVAITPDGKHLLTGQKTTLEPARSFSLLFLFITISVMEEMCYLDRFIVF